ncbi:DinB family protein [Bacillus oleivorans]|uniref:DinB family protein n=1 Tax=Bacillus oleivorans TaxID=1448271 RepID=A0A285D3L0_9BACI|nr:DinB family protein [Bacillus oleivorans]SNX74362.1 DinB family protein [Bacillus oleivorans]
MEKRHDLLFTQLETYRSHILDVLSSITEEEAEGVPQGFNNNIRWNMGHIYLDQYLWIHALTKDTDVPKEYNTWFGFSTSPANFTSETPTFAELKELLRKQPTHIKEMYGDRLEVEYPPTEMGMHTMEQVLIRTIFHEGMHLQTILDILKCLKVNSLK